MKIKLTALLSLALALLSLFSLSPLAYAHDIVDLNRQGSITLTMLYDGKSVPGGELQLYKVAEVEENDGNFFFEALPEFAVKGMDINDMDKAQENAEKLDKKIGTKEADQVKTPDAKGKVVFSKLTAGLYLIRQETAAEGYEPIHPFLVSLPYLEDGKYRYDLDTLPKFSPDLETEPTTEPTVPTTTKPSGDIPQTGQLWWPVPALLCLGMALICAGMGMRKKENYENEI